MKIDDKLIDYIATLSQLQLSESEKQLYEQDLTNILNHMEKLNELDTDNVPEMTHPIKMSNVFRDDVVTNEDRRSEMLRNAPDSKGDYFKVLKTVEE